MLGSASYHDAIMSPGSLGPTAALRVLAHAWGRARTGDQAALHDVRVATRRLREALRLLDGHARGRRKLRQRLRRVTRALGPVREIDVSRGLLASLASQQPELVEACERLDARLADLEQARRARFLKRMDETDVARLIARIDRALARRTEHRPLDRGRLAGRVADRADRAARAVETAGALYAPERLHDLRIETKKLRYALEIARQRRLAGAARAIARLRQFQDLLGGLHDLQVLAAHVRRHQVRMPADDADVPALSDLLSHIEDRCRQLHATFVARRSGLVVLADELALTFSRMGGAARPA
jgi:CHAD domain-containing protein